MKDKKRISRIIEQARPFFEPLPHVEVVYLFGSVLESASFNDLDFAVFCTRRFSRSGKAFATALQWGSKLESHLKPRTAVDLRLLNDAPVQFQHEVIQKGEVVFERDRDIRVRFEARVLTNYMDYEATRRFFNEYVLSEFSR